MNREILFRGKIKNIDELIGKGFLTYGAVNSISKWVYGVPIPRYPDLFLAWSEGNGEYEEITIISKSITQHTGLTDKNGVKIFESDIVRTKYGRLCVVVWFSSTRFAGWDLIPVETENHYPDRYDLWHCNNLEVVGNVFDNPELLRKD